MKKRGPYSILRYFDRVWHQGLLYKLCKIGIKGKLLQWFENYLENRKQRLIINGQASSWATVPAGVPQGSLLGPLLFIVYINYIVEGVNSNIKLFADDSHIC